MDRSRRALLRSAALAAGSTLAGCLGGTSDGPATGSPLASGGSPSSTEDVPPATGTPTRTDTPTLIPAGECDDTGDPLCDEPAHLLAFDENEPTLSPGETTTLASEVYNPYLFEVRVLEVALDAQAGGWTITPTFDAEIGLLAPETGREVAWTVTVPDAAAGTYDLTATTRYTAGRRLADVAATQEVRVEGT